MPIYPYSFTMPPVNKQDIPSDGVVGEFLGISAGGVLDWLPVSASGSGDLLAANNLSELTPTAGTARTNLGLGTGDSPQFKNLVISAGTLTSDAPVTISQTWNAVGQTFKAFVVNAAGTSGTNSASGSLLADFQVGTVSQLSVRKDGFVQVAGGMASPGGIYTTSATPNLSFGWLNGGTFGLSATAILGWTASDARGAPDTILVRDSASGNTLALRNGAAAQTFRVYNTYTDASNYERVRMNWISDTFAIFAEAAGTGTLRNINIGGAITALWSGSSLTRRWNINASGHFTAEADNTYDIGASGANRPRNIYVGTSVFTPSIQINAGGGIQNSTGTGVNLSFVSGNSQLRFDTGGGVFWTDSTNNPIVASSVAVMRNATGVIEVNSGTLGAYRDLILRNLNASGNVGIGTTSPTSKIDVEGSARLGGVANIDRTAGTLANIISLQARGAAESSNFGNPLGNGAGEISENGLSGLIIGTRSTASVVLGTSNTERMRILAVSGNVAIGATAAASKLTVTSGDVEVATIASGLILKSPDGTRYRVTVPNGGASLTITAV